MEELRKLSQQFREAAHAGGPVALYDAEVIAINEDQYTADVKLDDLPIYDVRLRAVVSEKHSIDVLPKIGSQVVIGKMGDDDYILIAADEITSYQIAIGTTVLTIDGDGCLISKGTETLKKILTDLVTGVLSIAAAKDVPSITALLTRIENLLK